MLHPNHPIDEAAPPENADYSTTQPTEPTTLAIWHDEISFDGKGYVELDKKLISHDWDMRMEITLSFSTWTNEGLILWQGSRQQDSTWGYVTSNYMALGSKLKICCAAETCDSSRITARVKYFHHYVPILKHSFEIFQSRSPIWFSPLMMNL